jgi:hypothetical protein
MIKSAIQVCILITRMASMLMLMGLSVHASASIELAIDELLVKADIDLAADRLMQPTSSNAVDRYRAVLLLDKTNQRATLGLRDSVARYLVLAESKRLRGEYKRALDLLASAEAINGKSVKSTAMKQSIKAAQRTNRLVINKSKIVPFTPEVNPLQTVFNLDPADLSARNETIKTQLVALASRVRESKEYVLIYARNDAEGRWVYQQMREATENYRLRGNIKRHKKPRVVLDEPLD